MSGKGDDKNKKPKTSIDADAVRELAALLKETGLTEIEIEHNGAKIRVSRGGGSVAAAPAITPAAAAPAASGPAAGPVAGAVTSPMVGTIYCAPEPGKPNFVKLG